MPLGPVAFKVGLASALCGAGAAAQTAVLGKLVAGRVRTALAARDDDRDDAQGERLDATLGAAAGVLTGLSYALAFQSVRPEVYALSTLLVMSAAVELSRFDATGDRRRLYLGALWAGLALSNHHLLALALLVPGLALAVARRPQKPVAQAIARVGVAGTLGLGLFAYLPLRALHHPLVDWGAPLTWSRVYWTVSAQAFQKAVARGSTGDVPGVVAALAAQLHPIGALLGVAGVYLLLRTPRLRRWGAFLVGVALLDAAMPAMVGFDPANPDAYGYLAASVAMLAVCACALPAALLVRVRGRLGARAQLVPAGLCALALLFGALGFPSVSLASRDDAAPALSAWLGSTPTRGLAVTSYFQTVFGVFYLRSVEGQRPDVDLVHRHFLAYPGYRDELVLKTPSLGPLLGDKDIDPLAVTAHEALLEYDLDLPQTLVARSQTVDARPLPDETQGRRFAGWQAFLAAHRACRANDRGQMVRTQNEARAILGDSPELDELAARCRP